MTTKPVESIALIASLALCVAFLVSFVTGLGFPAPSPDLARPGPATPAVDPGAQPRGRIEVHNASQRVGLAREAMSRLRDAGFDVVTWGNAPEDTPDSTMVIDRVGNGGLARAVASALGIDRIRTVIDSARFVDASVVVGVDWNPR
jgi:hypothetical protein